MTAARAVLKRPPLQLCEVRTITGHGLACGPVSASRDSRDAAKATQARRTAVHAPARRRTTTPGCSSRPPSPPSADSPHPEGLPPSLKPRAPVTAFVSYDPAGGVRSPLRLGPRPRPKRLLVAAGCPVCRPGMGFMVAARVPVQVRVPLAVPPGLARPRVARHEHHDRGGFPSDSHVPNSAGGPGGLFFLFVSTLESPTPIV